MTIHERLDAFSKKPHPFIVVILILTWIATGYMTCVMKPRLEKQMLQQNTPTNHE